MVVDQLRCAGVIEAIRISRAGFPARMPLKEFALRFVILIKQAAGQLGQRLAKSAKSGGKSEMKAALDALARGADARETCRAFMAALSPSGDDDKYQIGTTRVYFKLGVLEILEEQRALLMQAAATELVRSVRGWIVRKKYQRTRCSILRLQADFRMRRARKTFLKIRHAVLHCQAARRAVLKARRELELRRLKSAIRIQSWRRGCLQVRIFLKARNAAIRIQAMTRCRQMRRQYLVNLKEHKEQAKLENQVKALQAKLEAAEKASKSGGGVAAPAGEAEPSGEILRALEALATENAKLKVQLDKMKTENAALRQENQELRNSHSSRNDWISVFSRGTKKLEKSFNGTVVDSPDEKRPRSNSIERVRARHKSVTQETGERKMSNDSNDSFIAASSSFAPSASVKTHSPEPWQHYQPLCHFWGDVPCAGIPLLKRSSEVHIKFGGNILMLDEKQKHLMWRPWMSYASGYFRSMGFTIERRKEKRAASLRKSIVGNLLNSDLLGKSDDHSPGPGEDGCIGLSFALRSTFNGKFISTGGMFDRCLQISAEKPEDAAVFTIVPMPTSTTSAATAEGEMTDADYYFALRLLGDNKYVSLRKDGYVHTTTVADDDRDIDLETMGASLEYLVPLTSYEICVEEEQIGLTVGKDLPLRVVGFSAVAKRDGVLEPGPAEGTGRVRIGDVIRYVNGQDISGIPRKDVLNMISCKRPATLGFATSAEIRRS
jgi:hypothetical protein